MTISGTSTSITVDGTGLVSTFNYDFYMGGSSAYAVLVFIDSAGAETTITSADFSITGVTSQSGGTFTYPLVGSPIAVGEQLRLSRVLPLTQNAAIGNQGSFYPSVVEGALDNLEMQIQQVAAGSGATIDAASLFGNSGSSAGAGSSIPIGSGLSFSGNTLVVSGISGSGTVTSVDTGTGLTGGPITGVGTVALASMAASSILANPTTASAAPTAVTLGSGLSFSGSTLVATSPVVFVGSVTASIVTASLTVGSIPGTHQDIEFVLRARDSENTTNVSVNMQFNGDTGSNYMSEQLAAVGSGGVFAEATSATFSRIGNLPALTATASFAGVIRGLIGAYANTVFKKAYTAEGGYAFAPAANGIITTKNGGLWNSTASITTLTVVASTGFITGSSLSVFVRL